METGRVSNSGNGGHAAADQLVTSHLWLVRAVAKKVLARLPSHVELNDLVEEGVFGLIAAARRYDPARGVSFPLYAKHRIRGAIVDGLRRMDYLSRDSRSKAKKSAQEQDPSSVDWRACGATHDAQGREIAFAGGASAGAPEPVAGAGWRPDVMAGHEELSATLRGAMRTLPTRYSEIVALYHWRGLTMREIGRSYGINESRVSQIHKRALELMAASLRSKGITSCAAALP